MDTKKTKTAVIILLAIANIFFIYNIISLKISSENIPSEMIDDAVSILARHGFSADRSVIPERKPAFVLYEGIYSRAAFADIVKDFSGVSDEEAGDTDGMPMPAGRVYAAGDHMFIFSDDDYFSISIMNRDHINIEEHERRQEEVQEKTELLSESGGKKIQDAGARRTERTVRDFLRRYQNQDARLGFEIIEIEEERTASHEYRYIWINQTVDGVPVDSHFAYIEMRDGGIKYFSGRWYFGELTAIARRMPLLDSVNILFKSREIDGHIIQSGDGLSEMAAEYSLITHERTQESVSFYFVPSWRLRFESGKNFSYNMIYRR